MLGLLPEGLRRRIGESRGSSPEGRRGDVEKVVGLSERNDGVGRGEGAGFPLVHAHTLCAKASTDVMDCAEDLGQRPGSQ